MTERILLGQLGSNGDCLYATILARQIKNDYPNCRLTWAVSSLCRGMVENNPDVDEIWEIPVNDSSQQSAVWCLFEQEAWRRVQHHEFDLLFLSQIWPNNFQRFDGTIRPSILRTYPRPITVPIKSILKLTAMENEQVYDFVTRHGLENFQHRILFECASKSGQSFVTPDYALETARLVIESLPDACLVLSSHSKIKTDHPRIIDGSELSLRQNAALSLYCTLLTGCASGVTVTTITTAGKNLPMIQLLNRHTSVFASFHHDYDYWGLPNGHIIEMTNVPAANAAEAITHFGLYGIEETRFRFHEEIPVEFSWYQYLIDLCLLRKKRFLDAAHSLLLTAERYGWRSELIQIAREQVIPFWEQDPIFVFRDKQEWARDFEAHLVTGRDIGTR